MGVQIKSKFISGDMTTDVELAAETTARQNADTAIQSQLDSHASQHLPSGTDALATASAGSLSATTVNAEGTADSFARSDHSHSIATGTPVALTPDTVNTEGTS